MDVANGAGRATEPLMAGVRYPLSDPALLSFQAREEWTASPVQGKVELMALGPGDEYMLGPSPALLSFQAKEDWSAWRAKGNMELSALGLGDEYMLGPTLFHTRVGNGEGLIEALRDPISGPVMPFQLEVENKPVSAAAVACGRFPVSDRISPFQAESEKEVRLLALPSGQAQFTSCPKLCPQVGSENEDRSTALPTEGVKPLPNVALLFQAGAVNGTVLTVLCKENPKLDCSLLFQLRRDKSVDTSAEPSWESILFCRPKYLSRPTLELIEAEALWFSIDW